MNNRIKVAISFAMAIIIFRYCDQKSNVWDDIPSKMKDDFKNKFEHVLGKPLKQASDSEITAAWINPEMTNIKDSIAKIIVKYNYEKIDAILNKYYQKGPDALRSYEAGSAVQQELKINGGIVNNVKHEYFKLKVLKSSPEKNSK
jgi:hypothetical protein